jgi:hypothetical protein
MQRTFKESAFWREEDKSILTCLETTNDPSGVVRDFPKNLVNGASNPDYEIAFEYITKTYGADAIDKYTQKRKERHVQERLQRDLKDRQRKKSAELEELFQQKLKAFEIETIKNSENRQLRTKIRKASNVIEMNAWVTILMIEEMKKDESTDI